MHSTTSIEVGSSSNDNNQRSTNFALSESRPTNVDRESAVVNRPVERETQYIVTGDNKDFKAQSEYSKVADELKRTVSQEEARSRQQRMATSSGPIRLPRADVPPAATT